MVAKAFSSLAWLVLFSAAHSIVGLRLSKAVPDHITFEDAVPASTPVEEVPLIIFDWDDTILPTTMLSDTVMAQSAARAMFLSFIDEAAAQVLKLAHTLGKPVIVTNAKNGWVEHTAFSYLPEVYKVLKYTKVVYARDVYDRTPELHRRKIEHFHFTEQWKILGFLAVHHTAFKGTSSQPAQLISIGDSESERTAANVLRRIYAGKGNQVFPVKIVKLPEDPDFRMVHEHLLNMKSNLRRLVDAKDDLTEAWE